MFSVQNSHSTWQQIQHGDMGEGTSLREEKQDGHGQRSEMGMGGEERVPDALTITPRDTPNFVSLDQSIWTKIDRDYFDEWLDAALRNSGFSIDLMKAGIVTGELVPLVWVSSLPSAERLTAVLDDLSKGAEESSQGLQKFKAAVLSAIDHISIADDFAVHQQNCPYLSRPWLSDDEGLSKSQQLEPWVDPTAIASAFMKTLLVDGELYQSRLVWLKQQLAVLHELIVQDHAKLTHRRATILAQWWTYLGWNQDKLHHLDSDLTLIHRIDSHRRHALAYTVGALQTLQELNNQIQDSLQTAQHPAFTGYIIPVRLQSRSIQTCLERLKRVAKGERKTTAMKRISAVPLDGCR
ncbi:uncharacterized protein LAESUDRAFT_763045 [Laetiporus sulphureus 93-53]|uniref:Uncharacterized protein n=1 Tax=Laetiporus sulphureus 93-53 TaxID=1314785 RepID=A0A165C304_9APHY|nr:uncharacterized protein LAESUDRAFT_763045 [Laetiporus sulphureus 93-53]KZT02109.1 hypothetical protein LAESUDRAFT_763045 [Laetiporus sulphureus 93-53]